MPGPVFKTNEPGHRVSRKYRFSGSRGNDSRSRSTIAAHAHAPTRLGVPGPKMAAVCCRRCATDNLNDGPRDWAPVQSPLVVDFIHIVRPPRFCRSRVLRLSNDGVEKLPRVFGQEGETTVGVADSPMNGKINVLWGGGGRSATCHETNHAPGKFPACDVRQWTGEPRMC